MEPIEWRQYEPLHKYPHMAPADVLIWERFIATNPTAFDLVAYDVPVGAGAEFDTVVVPDTGAHVNRLYQRRIDVVGRSTGHTWVIELKPRASTQAVGQVDAYAVLFRRDYPEHKNVSTMIITDQLLPEMELIAQRSNVTIIVV
jgi:hypothetical protein